MIFNLEIKEIRKEIYEFEIDPKELKNVTKQIEELCVEVSMCEMPKTKIDNENIEEFRNVKEIEKKIHQIKEKYDVYIKSHIYQKSNYASDNSSCKQRLMEFSLDWKTFQKMSLQ